MKNPSTNQFNFSRTDRQRSFESKRHAASLKELPGRPSRAADYQSWKDGWWFEVQVEEPQPALTCLETSSQLAPAARHSASVWAAPPQLRTDSINMNDLLAPFSEPSSVQPAIVEMDVEEEQTEIENEEKAEGEEQVIEEEVDEDAVEAAVETGSLTEELPEFACPTTIDYIDWTLTGARKSAEMRNNVVVLPGLKSLFAHQRRGKAMNADQKRNAAISSALREMLNDDEEPELTNESTLRRKGERLLFGLKVSDSDAPNFTERAQDNDMTDPGVLRSVRGTIEMVLHPTGRKIIPRYNGCGMLVRVDLSDGGWFERGREEGVWRMFDENGRETLDQPIVSLNFDRIGNLGFITLDGTRTTLYTNGMISVDEPGRPTSICG